MVYLNAFGDMGFGARGVSLWTTHNDYPRRMRATPESTQRTGLGGLDESAVRAHIGQQAWTPPYHPVNDFPYPSAKHAAIERR